MTFASWVTEKFIIPHCKYYTPESTVLYGAILLLVVYGTYILLRKLRIKIDAKLFIAVLPFIIYGGITRALRDHEIFYTSKLFCSPPIYFIIFAITLSSIFIGLYAQKKWKMPYHQIPFLIGMVLIAFDLSLVVVNNYFAAFLIAGLVSFWAIALFGFSYWKPKILSRVNAGILLAHLLDASSTFVAMEFFGYYEQHVVPSYFIGMFGPIVFFPLKIAVVFTVLYLIDRYAEDKYFANFLKLVIVILGLAQGTRGFMTVGMLQA